jgi:hypothetical protein
MVRAIVAPLIPGRFGQMARPAFLGKPRFR